MQMSCGVIGHVTALNQSRRHIWPVMPPGGEIALDQSESAQKSAHLSDNRGLPRVAPWLWNVLDQ